MRRRTGASKAQQRQASVELLLRAALRLFVSQGYRSTNLEQISGAAGLTKGAVYFYFGSKEAVLLELLVRVRQIVVDLALEAVDAVGGTPRQRLIAYVHYQANLGITARDEVLLLILMSLEFKERDGPVRRCIADLYETQRNFMSSLITSGQGSGDFRADAPAREFAAMILATHDGTFLEWFRRSDELKGPDLVRALRGILLTGVTDKASAGQKDAVPRKVSATRKSATRSPVVRKAAAAPRRQNGSR